MESLTVKRLKEYGIHAKGEDLQMSRGRLGWDTIAFLAWQGVLGLFSGPARDTVHPFKPSGMFRISKGAYRRKERGRTVVAVAVDI